jgi:hypothetical protein
MVRFSPAVHEAIAVVQLHQHRVAGGALDHGGDLGAPPHWYDIFEHKEDRSERLVLTP